MQNDPNSTGGWQRSLVFDGNASPVKTTLFLIICCAWVLPGLIGHDPWKPDEAITFGVIHGMLSEGHWLAPMIAGLPSHEYPPLYYWVAALTAKLFSPVLALHDGARLATGFFMVVTLFFTHKTAMRLLDERAGRISVLLLIGCLGLFERGHEINPEVAGLAGMAVALYGLTRIRSEAWRGGRTTGIGAGVIALSIGVVPALLVPLIALALMIVLGETGNRTFRRGILYALAVLLLFSMAFPLALGSFAEIALAKHAIFGTRVFGEEGIDPLYFARTIAWHGLPALPFAVWLWWRDRAKLAERFELAMPLVAFAVLLVAVSLLRTARSGNTLLLLPPLALAAAHTLDRLPRGLASFMDAFSLFLFGMLALGGWFFWIAAITGVPAVAAGDMERQAPGFVFSLQWPALLVAGLMTLVWLYAVVRAHRNNRRAIVNWVAGLTMVWVMLNLLGLPAIDYVRSYRQVSATLAQQIATHPGCVAALEVGDPQRASFDYFAGVRLLPADTAEAASCQWLLTQGNRDYAPPASLDWLPVWEGARPGDKVERFRLYYR
ncbi:MAG: glycosyltransferase family 39 protein [Betaproteobacteria bacterium]|nr:glycosyltransferase family 39 protein [Betaproteobacteria bacterium]